MKPGFYERFWSRVDQSAGLFGCWPWLGYRDENGYGRVDAFGRRRTTASRVAFELSGGVIPDGMVACHTCDNPPCCNPAHIFAGTYADNTADMVAKGRHLLGERHWTRRFPGRASECAARARHARHLKRAAMEVARA
jgi:hypothetical protein